MLKKIFILAIAILVIAGFTGGYFFHKQEVDRLATKISNLEKTQLPQKQFKSYEECMGNDNGGIPLNTENGSFNACLGGNQDDTGEIPQHQAILQYSAQDLPRITGSTITKTKSMVTADGNYSADLIKFLEQNNEGCDTRSEYKLIKEVKDRFALLRYGCDGDGQVASNNPPAMVAMKLSTGWSLLSPTNNMQGDMPSCLLVDMFRISKQLSAKCFENTGYNNGDLKMVTYP